MLDQQSKEAEACEIKEKPHHYNKDQIISYLSFLEKLYEKESKNGDQPDQKRMLLINKAMNSVKKYSNFKVSPFRLNKSPLNKEEKKVKDECDIVEEKENEETDINDIMCLIEKELKLNGIDVNDIGDNSFLSTNQKSQNTDSNHNTANNKSNTNDSKNTNSEISTPGDTKQNPKKRLSKLFLKIEKKLKTYLQKEQEKDSKIGVISDKEKALQAGNNTINNKGLGKNFNVSNNGNIKLSKKPCKMPDLANSFFSNKKKVETMLSKAKKYKRKSMIEFNALHLLKPKKNKEELYFEDSNNKNIKKRVATALLERPQKRKIKKNGGNEVISNFNCGKIDAIIENKEECDDIIPFDKIGDNLEKENDNNEENMINQDPLFIDNNSSIKITSTINKNKLDLDKLHKESLKQFSLFKNDPNDMIIFNQDKESTLLDDNLFVQSSDKEESSGSKIEEEESDDSNSCSSEESAKVKENNCEDKKEDDKKNSISALDSSNKRTSNFNYFYRNSIFSPLKDLQDNNGKENNIMEQFSNLHL